MGRRPKPQQEAPGHHSKHVDDTEGLVWCLLVSRCLGEGKPQESRLARISSGTKQGNELINIPQMLGLNPTLSFCGTWKRAECLFRACGAERGLIVWQTGIHNSLQCHHTGMPNTSACYGTRDMKVRKWPFCSELLV